MPKRYGAPFVAGAAEHRVYRNARAGVAVALPAAEADGTLRVIVTAPERISEFVRD